MRLIPAVIAALFLSAVSAMAATVDASPIVEYGLETLNSIFVAVGVAAVAWAASWIKTKIGVDIAFMDNTKLHEVLQRGVDAAEGDIRDWVYAPGKDRTKIDVGNPLVAAIASRAISLSPDLIRRLGVEEWVLRKLAAEKIQAKAAQIAGQSQPRG